MDATRDAITRYGEGLHRTGGLVNLGAGSVGAVGGTALAVTGAAACPATLGSGCAAAVLGGYIAVSSSAQAQQGSQALFSKYTSSEGSQVLASFNPQTYPGERDPIGEVAKDAGMLGFAMAAGKYIPKWLSAAEGLTVPKVGGAAGIAKTSGKPEIAIVAEKEATKIAAAGETGGASRTGTEISNAVLAEHRVGFGVKGQGSGNKIDQISNQRVIGIDGNPFQVYPNRPNGPFATQEFPSSSRAHGAPDMVDNYAGGSTPFQLGNGSTLYQLSGGLNGKAGRFEWIVDPTLGGITHRMFVPGGTINGKPITP